MLLFICSAVSDSEAPWTTACQASLSFTVSRSLLKLVSVELMVPSHPLSPPSPPALNLSQRQELV